MMPNSVKSRKKSNRKVRRRIRKTTAVIFLITSIVIATIPVPKAKAESITKTDVEEDYPSGSGQQSTTGTDSTKIPQIKVGDASQNKIIVYSSGDGQFQFTVSSVGNLKVANIVGYSPMDLSSTNGQLVVPSTMDAYVEYAPSGSGTKRNVAASKNDGSPLFYKWITKIVTTTASDGSVDNTPVQTSYAETASSTTETPADIISTVEKDGVTVTTTVHTAYIYRFMPCYYTTYGDWSGADVKYYVNDDVTTADTSLIYTDDPSLQAANTSYLNKNSTQCGAYKTGSDITTRLTETPVYYIGSQYVTRAADTDPWTVTDSGVTASTGEVNGVFANKKYIKSLSLPGSLIGIGNYAFYGCTSLGSVTISDFTSVIGKYAFANCTSMSSFGLGSASSVDTISDSAFENCKSLTAFTIPVATTKICDNAFKGDGALSTVDFSAAKILTDIGNDVFRNCTSLQTVDFPDDLTNVGYGTFKGCSSLTDVYFPAGYTASVRYSTFQGDKALKHIQVDGDGSQLTFTDSSGNAQSKGYVYDYNGFMDEISAQFYFEGYNQSAIHTLCKEKGFAFKYMDNGMNGLYEKVVADSTDANKKVTYQVNDKQELVNVEINPSGSNYKLQIPESIGPYAVTKIGSEFKNDVYITEAVIPTTITEIEDSAFEGCYQLSKVTFEEPNNLTRIGTNAFKTQDGDLVNSTDTNLRSTDRTLEFIGTISSASQPFLYAMNAGNYINNIYQSKDNYIDFCSGNPSNLHVKYNPEAKSGAGAVELTSVPEYSEITSATVDSTTGSEYVIAIKNAMIEDGTLQEGVDNSTAATAVGNAISIYQKELTGAALSNGETKLSDLVYNTIDSCYNISVPTGVQTIRSGLFSPGSDTNTVSNATGIDVNATNSFSGTTANNHVRSITTYDIEGLDDYAFYDCNALESVTMYPSAGATAGESIGKYAFGQCDALSSVALPSTTSSMGIRPFAGDKALTTVNFIGSASGSTAPTATGTNFASSNGLLYQLSNGSKSSLVECLESRNSTATPSIGSSTISADELSGLTSIYDEALLGVTGVGKVDLSSSSVKIIPARCFANATKLHEAVLPNSCTTIKENAFYNTALEQITIPSTTTHFDNSAFNKQDSPGVIQNVTVSTSKDSAASDLVDANAIYGWKLGEAIKQVYTVVFYDMDGKTVLSTQSIEDGADAVAPSGDALPTHEGYTFTGWDRDYTAISQDMSINAVYSKTTFTVNFRDWDYDTILATRTVAPGGSADEPKSPTRTGYTFTGWTKPFTNVTSNVDTMAVYTYNSSSSSGSGSSSGSSGSGSSGSGSSGSSSSSSSSSSTTSSTAYTLTVVNGSGSGSYVSGATVVIAAYTPSPGYRFAYWTSSESGTAFASSTMSATSFTMPSKAITITANYVTTSSVSGNNTVPAGTVTTSRVSNTGSTTGVRATTSGNNSGIGGTTGTGTNGNSGTKVDVEKNGISNANLASATVSGSTDDFTVRIKENGDATEAVAKALKNEYGDLTNIRYTAMDISLYDAAGTTQITDTKGLKVTITIPIPDELVQYAGNNKVGGVINGDQLDKLTPTFSTINDVTCVTFTATHFSPYTVYVDTSDLSAGAADVTPKTGDALSPKWFLSIGLALIAVVLFLKKDQRPIPELRRS